MRLQGEPPCWPGASPLCSAATAADPQKCQERAQLFLSSAVGRREGKDERSIAAWVEGSKVGWRGGRRAERRESPLARGRVSVCVRRLKVRRLRDERRTGWPSAVRGSARGREGPRVRPGESNRRKIYCIDTLFLLSLGSSVSLRAPFSKRPMRRPPPGPSPPADVGSRAGGRVGRRQRAPFPQGP